MAEDSEAISLSISTIIAMSFDPLTCSLINTTHTYFTLTSIKNVVIYIGQVSVTNLQAGVRMNDW